MTNFIFRFFLSSLFIFFPALVVLSQNGDDLKIEQLGRIEKIEKQINYNSIDTTLVHQTSELSRLYSSIKMYDKAIKYVEKSIAYSKQLNDKKGEASAYASLGSIYYDLGQYDKAIKKLTFALEKCKENKQEVDMTFIYRYLGESYLNIKDTAQAIHFHKEGLALCQKLKIQNRIVFAEDFLGHIYFHQNKYVKAIHHFKNSLAISQKIENNNRVALSAGNIGMSYISLNEKREGIKYLTLALKYYKIDKNTNGSVWMHTLIADIYKEIGEYSKALEYNGLNLMIHRINKNSLELAKTYNQQGEILTAKGDFPKAESLFNKALEIYKNENSQLGEATVLANFGEIYYLKEEHDKAYAYLKKGRIIANSLTNKNIITLINTHIGAILIKKGEVLAGKNLLENSLLFYQNIKATKQLPFIYQNLAISDSILGDYASAFSNYKLFINHHNNENKDKFYTEKTAYQYEFEKKQGIVEAELKTKKAQRNAAIVALILLSFIVVIIIYFFRLRNKKLKIERENIELQKREIERIKELENFKSRFLTNITHEFRTPLTLIKGYLEVTKESHPEIQHLDEMEYNSNQMLHLINQLIGLSKMESGNYQLKFRKGDILQTSESAIAVFESLAKQKGIQYSFIIDDFTSTNFNPSEFVYSKEVVLTTLTNLLSNAFKYTPKGGEIKILIGSLDAETMTICVTDTGIGIPERDVEKIFDRYHQVDSPTQRTYEGSGIGLAIVKEMVALHGGETFVDSKINKGTTFTIHLKNSNEIVNDLENNEIKDFQLINNSLPSTEFDENQLDASKKIILLVEDNAEIRKFIVNNLHENYQIIEASNGKEGIELAEKHLPDLIISDVMMPDTDGLELCGRLKNNFITSHIPIILLTAKSDDSDKIIGLEQGADDYVTKPFSLVEIRLRIRNILRTRELFRNKFDNSKVLTVEEKNTAFNQKDKEFIEKIENIIANNISNQLFGVPNLAEEIFLSSSQLSRKLKCLINKTPGAYIQNMRLEEARKLLLDGYDVSETAWKVGFEDPVYFSKVFKKHFGTSPSFIKN